MTQRLLLLQLLVLGGLSTIFLLPKTPPIRESAAHLELPRVLIATGWQGGPKIEPSEKELKVLADDTNFARRDYYRQAHEDGAPNTVDRLQTSIVMSGKNLNNSLHRPERCLPAQGLNLESEKCEFLYIPLAGGQVLPVRKLYCTRTDPETQQTGVYLNYYWFTGHDTVTASHYGRTMQDMKDRLMKGYDQRWAYITVSTYLMDADLQDENGRPFHIRKLTEEQADTLVGEFLQEIAPEIISLAEIKTWK